MSIFFEDFNNLVSVSNSILRHYHLERYHTSLAVLDQVLDQLNDKKICLVLLDGFGREIQEQYKEECPFFRSGYFQTITSVFPPTTVAATTSLLSGKYPCETGWLGWTEKMKEEKLPITMFSSTYADETMTKAPFDTYQRFAYKNLVQLIRESGKKADMIQSFTLEDPSLENFFAETKERVKQNDFLYAYCTEPDHKLHEEGVHGENISALIHKIDQLLKDLILHSKDTIFIVLADHGHRDVKFYKIEEHEDFFDTLQYPFFAIEPRAATFFVKRGKEKQFEETFQKYYQDEFYLFTKKEVIEKEIFGRGVPCDEFESLLGDYLLVSKGDAAFDYGEDTIMKSHHAGSSKEERDINLSLYNT